MYTPYIHHYQHHNNIIGKIKESKKFNIDITRSSAIKVHVEKQSKVFPLNHQKCNSIVQQLVEAKYIKCASLDKDRPQKGYDIKALTLAQL